MNKKVLIISASLRKGSNSEMLAKEFEKGALKAGNEVEIVSLRDKSIGFCRGCLACPKLEKCVIDDDAVEITEKMKSADVLVFATPVYYNSVSGQLKTMLDRANSMYNSDYKFTEIYLLATAAEEGKKPVEGAKKAVQGWIDCFERARLSGVVFAGGVKAAGDISGHQGLTEAYEVGKNV